MYYSELEGFNDDGENKRQIDSIVGAEISYMTSNVWGIYTSMKSMLDISSQHMTEHQKAELAVSLTDITCSLL